MAGRLAAWPRAAAHNLDLKRDAPPDEQLRRIDAPLDD
jgi:hypothetical protein